jgi:dTDP-4-amino-4,6-dideoxygalactose transaminase
MSPTPAMPVPLLDLKLQYRPLAAEIQAAIEKVCASQAFILGPGVKELEAGIAAALINERALIFNRLGIDIEEC